MHLVLLNRLLRARSARSPRYQCGPASVTKQWSSSSLMRQAGSLPPSAIGAAVLRLSVWMLFSGLRYFGHGPYQCAQPLLCPRSFSELPNFSPCLLNPSAANLFAPLRALLVADGAFRGSHKCQIYEVLGALLEKLLGGRPCSTSLLIAVRSLKG